MLEIQSTINKNMTFKASINKNTPAMKTVCAYMERCKDYEYPYKDTKTELDVFRKVEKALAKHPSKEVLNITRILDNRFFWNERALIKSTKASFVDVEPVRDDSIAGELGVIRRILDPENKDMFNQLMGEEHSNKYDKWWKKHISPIWDSVNSLYRENPAIEPNITDEQYNECFRKQIDIYESPYLKKNSVATQNNLNEEHSKDSGKIISAFAVGMAFVVSFIFLINKIGAKKCAQQQKEIVTTQIKDSLNKLSSDTLDLTKHFIKK